MARKYDPIRYNNDPAYRARINAARRGGKSRSPAKRKAVRANLERARAVRFGQVENWEVPDPNSRNAAGLTPREEFVRWSREDLPRLRAERRQRKIQEAMEAFGLD